MTRTALSTLAAACTDYADMIATVRAAGLKIGKYADPTEGERMDLTDEQAMDVAREDISLLYVYAA